VRNRVLWIRMRRTTARLPIKTLNFREDKIVDPQRVDAEVVLVVLEDDDTML
jgi:hypothetical protein